MGIDPDLMRSVAADIVLAAKDKVDALLTEQLKEAHAELPDGIDPQELQELLSEALNNALDCCELDLQSEIEGVLDDINDELEEE
tara:strand:- start:2200 stop:2454 length:255 start_codon:yes stop_codon:yes gene_type:complete